MAQTDMQSLQDKLKSLTQTVERLTKTKPNFKASETIHLPTEECPADLVACDAWEMECPPEEEGPNPAMVTSAGDYCYPKQSMARAKRLNDGGRASALQSIRQLVVAAAKLNAKLAGIGQADIACIQVTPSMFYGDADEKKERQRQFCGTLMKSDGKNPKCTFNDTYSTCAPMPPPLPTK